MKHVLVGVDGSEQSRLAAKKGAEIAAGMNAMVRLVCVVPPFHAFVNVVGSPREISDERAAAKEILGEVAATLNGAQVETQIAEGIPGEVLASLAAEPEVDTVVVGHRGHGIFSRILLGSTANRLVQISPKPVLVVR